MRNYLADALPFWQDLTTEEREQLVAAIEVKDIRKGTTLYRAGMNEANLVYVISGVVRVFLETPEGNEITLYRLKAGDICILSIVCQMYTSTADIRMEVEQNARISTAPAAICQRLNEENGQVKNFIQKMLLERLWATIEVVSELAFSTVSKRLSDSLLQQIELVGGEELSITHEALAKDIGSAREVVSRTLKNFEEKGLVELSRGRVRVLDREGLIKQ